MMEQSMFKIAIQKLLKDSDGEWHPFKVAGLFTVWLFIMLAWGVRTYISVIYSAPYGVQKCCAEKCLIAKDAVYCKIDCVKYNLCMER